MLLQKIIFPNKSTDCDELYVRNGASQLSFDTYFNSFSYTKYRDYTNVYKVTFIADFKGCAVVQLCVFNGEEKVVFQCEAENHAKLTIQFSQLPEKGFLYPKFIAKGDFQLLNGGYYSDCETREVNCCIAICTFKREQFVLRNIELLKNSQFSFINRVFVIDNGQTLDVGLSDDFINILPNKNYGGSGGFTRGLIEAHDGGFSHVILMDDDVEFHSETLEQMTVFLSILNDRYSESWFSAGMFPLDKQWEQFELGAEWNGKCAVVHKHRLDIRQRENLLSNLDNPDVGYGGWWTLCMPVSVVKNGLPYPFFIKFDDVEYGMRKSSEVEIITMNGISVRHEAFDKKTSFVLDYYNLRNELAVNAVYGKYGAGGAVKRFWYEVCKQLVLYRYDNIPLVIRAVKDFLQGAEFFINRDDDALNSELIKTVPKLTELEKNPEWSESMRCDEHVKCNDISAAMLLTLGGHLIPSFALKKDISAFPLSRISAADTFMRKKVIQYQMGGNAGIVTKRNFSKFVKYSFKAIAMLPTILFGYEKARKSFIDKKFQITSIDFWKSRLDIK